MFTLMLILCLCLNAQVYSKSYLIEMQEIKNGTDYSILGMTCCCDAWGKEVKYGQTYKDKKEKSNCNTCWCGKPCTFKACPTESRKRFIHQKVSFG